MLSVLAPKEQLKDISRLIFENTTTIGFRYFEIDRVICEREFEETFLQKSKDTCKKGISRRKTGEYFP